MATKGKKPGRKKKETEAEKVEVAPVEKVVKPAAKPKKKSAPEPVKEELPPVVEPVKETPTPVVEEKVEEVVEPVVEVKETPAPQPSEEQVQVREEVKAEEVVKAPRVVGVGSVVMMPTGQEGTVIGKDLKGRFLVRKTSNQRRVYAYHAAQLSLVK